MSKVSSIASALGNLQGMRKHPGAQAPESLGAEAPKPVPLQGTAKSKHPDFTPVKVYLRSETRKAAERKWEDAKGGDFSDLVEMLLQKYLSA